MKIIIAAVVFFVSFSSFAFDDNPYNVFDANKRFTDTSNIVWRVVQNASAVCEYESRRRGFGGFGKHVEACSFWNDKGDSTCTIITNNITNMHQIGHEMRHCFQGAYHD